MPSFTCKECQTLFTIPPETLAKFPGWSPKVCMKCKKPAAKKTSSKAKTSMHRDLSRASSREENLTPDEVLAKYTDGPTDGVFTDGAADPNPGPGGWGAVYVIDNKVVAQDHGHKPHTTNNQMELTALVAGCQLIPLGTPAVIYSDSKLCVDTFNIWAKDWEKRGWKKKKGDIKNLELVQEVYDILQNRPEISLKWIQAHAGYRWNEYADSLATAYRRKEETEKIGTHFNVPTTPTFIKKK
jgi:ribonuclease HI